ncbi:hypothetical protein M0802_014294 [Mischocyttarus mexicanus]|nr:hypothetical protein M0802_014294 [Mischocyttarus mexicanus]
MPVARNPKKVNKDPREEAFVSVTIMEGGGSYKDALLKAREAINLKDIEVDGMRCRRRATGAYLFEIKGPGSRQKARSIAEVLKTKVTGVKVGVSVRTGHFKVCGLNPGTTIEEIKKVVVELNPGTDPSLIRVCEILVGRGGLCQVFVTAPIEIVRLAVEKGTIVVGWCRARIYAVDKRLTRYYRCQARGHVGAVCPSPVVRLNLCYRCGEEGHIARGCVRKVCCPVCKDAGRRDTDHTVGSWLCPPVALRELETYTDGSGPAPTPVRNNNETGVDVSVRDAVGLEAPSEDVDMDLKVTGEGGCDKSRCYNLSHPSRSDPISREAILMAQKRSHNQRSDPIGRKAILQAKLRSHRWRSESIG